MKKCNDRERPLGAALKHVLGRLATIVAVILPLLLLGGAAVVANAAEWRAFWVDAWGAGFLNQGQVETLLGVPGTNTAGRIRDANCNAVFVQVRRRADVCYPSGVANPTCPASHPRISTRCRR